MLSNLFGFGLVFEVRIHPRLHIWGYRDHNTLAGRMRLVDEAMGWQVDRRNQGQ